MGEQQVQSQAGVQCEAVGDAGAACGQSVGPVSEQNDGVKLVWRRMSDTKLKKSLDKVENIIGLMAKTQMKVFERQIKDLKRFTANG